MKRMLLFFFFILTTVVQANPIKIALIPPEGTNWADNMRNMVREVKAATAGEVDIKLYAGGILGDEPDILRKIRIGQLNGGVFSARILGELYGDLRMVEVPFSFNQDRAKAWKLVEQFTPTYNKGLEQKGFKNLGFFELGNIYLLSQKRVSNFEEMKGLKIWSWDSDKLVGEFLDTLSLTAVPLALPDVLPSLTTGVIEAAYTSPAAIFALQWQNKIKYLVDYPVAFSLSALVFSKKTWDEIPSKHHKLIESIAKKHIDLANQQMIRENNEALVVLKKNGVEFITFSASDLKKGDEINVQLIKKLTGPVLTAEMVKIFKAAAAKI